MDLVTFFTGLWISVAVFLLLATHLDGAESGDVSDAAGEWDA